MLRTQRRAGEAAPVNASAERFLAFGRVFSGRLREGQTVHVLSAAYTPAEPDRLRTEATVGALYLMMGRGLERLQVEELMVLGFVVLP
jgi:translation elongation factor EF-G